MTKRDFGLGILDNHISKDQSFSIKLDELRHTYGVLLKFEDENKKKLDVHYEIEIISLGKSDENQFSFLEIQKNQVYLNQKQPNNISDELAEKCGNILYPIQVEINKSGDIVSIGNYDEILKRWESEKVKFRQYYNSKEVEKLISLMDKALIDPENIKKVLIERDWFMTLFFSVNSKTTKKEIYLPFISYQQGVSFIYNQNISSHNHRKENIVITRKGHCNDTRLEEDILKGNPTSAKNKKGTVKGTFEMNYQIYKDSPVINMITGKTSLAFPSGKKKQMNIEVYHLKEKIPKTSEEKQEAVLIKKEQEPQPKQKKKRYFVFGKK